MDPIFIYFSKIDLKDNNKFTLDFPDEQNVEELIFLKNRDYYFISLNCNLIVKEHIDDKKRLIKELSQKSRLLSCWKYEYYDLVQKTFICYTRILLLEDLLFYMIRRIIITLGLMMQIV